MVHPEGFEPPVFRFVAERFIQLSYGCILYIIHTFFVKIKIFQKTSCKFLKIMLYYIGAKKSRCSAAGSARGLGPWGRRFEPCHLDQLRELLKTLYFLFLKNI